MASVFYCINCINYQGNGKCLAFPKGIPDQIKNGEQEHEKPLPEQENEIVFEEIDLITGVPTR